MIREDIIRAYKALVDSEYDPKDVEPVFTKENIKNIAEAAEQGGGGGGVTPLVAFNDGDYKFNAAKLLSLIPEGIKTIDMTGGIEVVIGVVAGSEFRFSFDISGKTVKFGQSGLWKIQKTYTSEEQTVGNLISLLDEETFGMYGYNQNAYAPLLEVSIHTDDGYDYAYVPYSAKEFNEIFEKQD